MAKKNRQNADPVPLNGGKPLIRKPKKKEQDIPLTDAQQFLHDLQLHQVELEIRNEELKCAKQESAILLHKYTQLFDLAPIAYFTVNADRLICDLNSPAASLFEQARASLVNQDFTTYLSGESKPVFRNFLDGLFNGGSNACCEVSLSRTDETPVFLSLKAGFSDKEQLCYLVATEITDRRIAEDVLGETTELYQSAFRKIPAMTLLLDPETEDILDVNPAAVSFYGYSVEQLSAMKFHELNMLQPKESNGSLPGFVAEEFTKHTFRHKLRSGKVRDVEASFDPIRIGNKKVLFTILEDVTERSCLDEVKREQEYWSQESYREKKTGTFVLDFASDTWTASGILEGILGIDSTTPRTINGFLSVIHPDQKAGIQYYLFSEVIARKIPFDKEFSIIRSNDGSERFVRVHANLELDAAGKLLKLAGTMQDITEHKQSEKLIAESESKYHLLMNAFPEGIVIFDQEGKITEISNLAQDQSGTQSKDELLGKHFLQFIPREERKKIADLIDKAVTDAVPQSVECRLLKPDNSPFISEISLSQIDRIMDDQKAFIAIVRDITARKKKEQQLIHMDRMAHLGEMATGMAHEINQPLNNISLTLDNIFHEIRLKDSLHDTYLQHKSNKVFDNIVKIKNLIEHIREFARDDHSYAQQTFDINETIHNALSVLMVQFDENRVDLVLDLEEKLDLYLGDAFKIEQVIMNLLLNANDALEEKERKSTGSFAKVIKIKSYQEKNTICVEITDNGIGIKAHELEKIMHPFYTTKETGKGVGLGLSISYGIISDMKGKIEVESKYLVGTTFRISIPGFESPK